MRASLHVKHYTSMNEGFILKSKYLKVLSQMWWCDFHSTISFIKKPLLK
ncbi:hypothetical protein X953_03260 [Virgibacillus sp. SK37]|nr:hypothetical protein X953_03260 [Virgibacillus sp. SK37]